MQFKALTAALVVILAVMPAAAQQNRGKAAATVKGKKITIDYGQPKLAGRDMIGMAKPGMVWRLGMDEATEIDTNATLVIAGKELKPGKYSLWAKKVTPTEWTLNFHPTTGIWGQPEMENGYVATLPLKLEKVANASDQLTIAVAEKAGDAAIVIHWGTTQLSGTVGVK